MSYQGIVAWPAFDRIYFFYRTRIGCVGSKAVNRLRWQGNQLAGRQQISGTAHDLGAALDYGSHSLFYHPTML